MKPHISLFFRPDHMHYHRDQLPYCTLLQPFYHRQLQHASGSLAVVRGTAMPHVNISLYLALCSNTIRIVLSFYVSYKGIYFLSFSVLKTFILQLDHFRDM